MPHLLPHRPCHRLTAPAAALIMLAALAECTSATTAGTQAASAAATTIRITGAGSTFDAPFFDVAFPRYQQQHPGITISYASVGSSAGITRFTAGQADFGATDVPASPADLAGARGGPAVQVPVDLGAVAVTYNGDVPGGPQLNLFAVERQVQPGPVRPAGRVLLPGAAAGRAGRCPQMSSGRHFGDACPALRLLPSRGRPAGAPRVGVPLLVPARRRGMIRS